MIIYCSYYGCPNEDCEKNIAHFKGSMRVISGNPECETYQAWLKELAIRDRKEDEEQARKESHDLDR